jgi:hypothetical protein
MSKTYHFAKSNQLVKHGFACDAPPKNQSAKAQDPDKMRPEKGMLSFIASFFDAE